MKTNCSYCKNTATKTVVDSSLENGRGLICPECLQKGKESWNEWVKDPKNITPSQPKEDKEFVKKLKSLAVTGYKNGGKW